MPRRLLLLRLLPLAAVLGGCAMAGPSEPVVDGSGKADSDEAPEAPALAAAYAMSITSHVVTAARDGSDRESFDSRIDGYVTPIATHDGLALQLTPCHLELPEADGRKPVLDDETVRGLGPISLPAVFTTDAAGELTLATQTGALELGVALDDALMDTLPKDEDDERLVDHDQDDETGVTIEIDGWEVYLAARARVWLAGAIDADSGVISGDADLSIDVQIYGDDIPFVDVRDSVEEAAEDDSREVVESVNGFELRPLAEAPMSCAALT